MMGSERISGSMRDGDGSSWVHDDCEKGYVYSIGRERAEGILRIHAPCEPPCPRKRAAREYLESGLSSSGE